MFSRIRDWISGRPKTRRFYSSAMLFMAVLAFLLIVALRAESFVENFALNLFTEIIGALIVIYLLEGRIGHALGEMRTETKSAKNALNNLLQAWERGEIPESMVVESNQWVSWHKWIHQGDVTGWAELIEAVRNGPGLSARIRSAIEWELSRVRKQAYEAGGLSAREYERDEKLQALLHTSPE